MANTATQKGARYPYSNSGAAIAVNGVVVLNSGSTGKIGIALDAIAATTGTGILIIGGPDEKVNTLTKKVGDVFTDMQIVYWDASNSRLTTSSTGNTRAGRAWGPAASAAATASIALND